MFKSLSPGLLALVLMLLEYLSGGAAFSFCQSWSWHLLHFTSSQYTPALKGTHRCAWSDLQSIQHTSSLIQIHSHLLHLFLSGSGHGTRRNHYTRDALQNGSAPFAGETKCGAFGPGLAIVDSARNPGRFDVGASNQSSLFHSGLRHLLHFLLSHQCSSFVCQDFKLVTYSSSGDSALTDTQPKLKKARPSWLFRDIVSLLSC
jgi:hypothetical protein